MSRATFTRMEDSTAQDWRVIGAEFAEFSKQLPDRVLKHLKLLDGDYGGFPDPKTEAMPLSEFEPLVRRVFGNVRNSVYKAAIASPASA